MHPWVELGKGGFKLLGAPMGDQGFKREILDKRVEGIRGLVTALPTLDNPHIEFSLLRSCFAFPKFAVALRSTDTTAHRYIRE